MNFKLNSCGNYKLLCYSNRRTIYQEPSFCDSTKLKLDFEITFVAYITIRINLERSFQQQLENFLSHLGMSFHNNFFVFYVKKISMSGLPIIDDIVQNDSGRLQLEGNLGFKPISRASKLEENTRGIFCRLEFFLL